MPAPSCLLGPAHKEARRPLARTVCAGPSSSRLPRPPPQGAEGAGRRAPKKPRPTPEPFLPVDRAEGVGGTKLRHGRCAFGPLLLAVPQRLEDFGSQLEDPDEELLLVELSAPDGAWLEDPEVEGVLVRPGSFVRIQAVRQLVRDRVNLFGRASAELKKLYQLVRPTCAPEYALALVAMDDLPPPESVDGACPPA